MQFSYSSVGEELSRLGQARSASLVGLERRIPLWRSTRCRSGSLFTEASSYGLETLRL